MCVWGEGMCLYVELNIKLCPNFLWAKLLQKYINIYVNTIELSFKWQFMNY